MQPKNASLDVGTEKPMSEELIDHTHGEDAVLQAMQQSTPGEGGDDGRRFFQGLETPVLVGVDVIINVGEEFASGTLSSLSPTAPGEVVERGTPLPARCFRQKGGNFVSTAEPC